MKLILLIGIPVIGVIAGYLLMGRTVQATIEGEPVSIRTHALTVKGALRSAGIEVDTADSVSPAAESWLSKVDSIEVNRARLVRIRVEPAGEWLEVETALLTPDEMLRAAGIEPKTADLVMVNGLSVPHANPLQERGELVLQYRPAVTLLVTVDGKKRTIISSAADIGSALWEAGIQLREGDRLSVPFDQPLREDMAVEIQMGRELEITADGRTVVGYSAAQTVGEALAEAGVALQDLDYSQPAEDEPLPDDGVIRVVRVAEELVLEQTAIPYETQLLADGTLEMDTRKVIQEGANGIKAARVRVRYEDGVEVSRVSEGDVIIAEAVTRIVHYGSKIVNKVADTADGSISYYMAVNVTATSYSPCRSGVEGKCYTGTSLGLPVQKGVIGVNRPWYDLFKGTQIYVPGYGVGTIADIGYYPATNYWIDLGYSDADYVSWGATNLTIYFLSPPPAGFTGVMP
jgi:uncharacterized protein YabE (DUF348 family)